MKKEIVFIVFLVFLLFGITHFASSKSSDKIDSKILKEFEEGKLTTRVIIDSNKTFDSFFVSLFEGDVRKEIGKSKIKHNLSENRFSAELSKEEITKLIDKGYSVEYVWPVKVYLQDSVDIINATPTWRLREKGFNLTGLHETVCILDTGVNFSHSNLVGNNLTCNIDCVGKACVENCSVSDDHGHGTHIAGIISASSGITGVSFESNLIGVKVLNSAAGGSTDDVLAGFQWCLDNSEVYNISVISMSLGCNETISGYSSYCDSSIPADNGCGRKDFTTKINNAFADNISVVVATGNDGWDDSIAAPACIQNSTRVGSSTKSDGVSIFSNTWNLPMLLAPGSSINSSDYNGGYISYSGTSMATPHAAGAIAIIKQFLRLSGQTKTPFEIEGVLNSTGEKINDTGGLNINYSRIDVYDSIISLDNLNPLVNLSSPSNATTSSVVNQTFSCNATDLSLKNMTLYLWNSTGIYNNTLLNVSGASNILELNLTNISEGTYFWNCLAYDEKGNSAWALDNYTLTITPSLMSINSPTNNSWANKGNFNLTLNEEGNCSFSLNNQENISMNTTDNLNFYYINNTLNDTSTSLEYNVTYYCNDSEGNLNSSSVIFFGVESVKPVIILQSPFEGYSQTIDSVNLYFVFNVTDYLNISSCELLINGTSDSITQNSSVINKTSNNTISKTLSSGTYSWKVNCTDSAGNENSSFYRNFVLNAPSSSSSSSSSGGGSGGGSVTANAVVDETEVSNENEVSNEDLNVGGEVILADLDKSSSYSLNESSVLEFNISSNHTLKIDDIENDSVSITIESDLINITLFVGEEKKLNLTSPNYFDLYIKLNNISGNQANIILKKIYEERGFFLENRVFIFGLIFVVLISVILFIYFIKRNTNDIIKDISRKKKEILKK